MDQNNTNALIHQTYYGIIALNPLSDENTEEQWLRFSKLLKESNDNEIDENNSYIHFHNLQNSQLNWQVRLHLTSNKKQAETKAIIRLKDALIGSGINEVEVAILLNLQYLDTSLPTGDFGGAFDDTINYDIIRTKDFEIDSIFKPAGSHLLKWKDKKFQQL